MFHFMAKVDQFGTHKSLLVMKCRCELQAKQPFRKQEIASGTLRLRSSTNTRHSAQREHALATT
jgi:hypothetical protein